MTRSKSIQFAKSNRVAVGTGFLPLDLVYRDDEPAKLKAYAGGTCGNVLAILGFLGWGAYPVARHDTSRIGQLIKEDLKRWNVHLDFMNQEPAALPPVVVQRVFRRPRGSKTHSFLWTCPGCGAQLPTYKPVLAKTVSEVSPRLPKASVFFFDRVSRAALDLAASCSKKGAVIVFEPSMIGDPRLLAEAFRVSHVVKYSQQRISDVREVTQVDQPALEIETLGAAGLRYRRPGSKWKEMESFHADHILDTSGAGDWCTAGILHSLCQNGLKGLLKASSDEIRHGLRIGQAMGAWACQFEGARGGMYGITWKAWKTQIDKIVNSGTAQQIPGQAVCPDVMVEICCPARDDRGQVLSSQELIPSVTSQVCATLLRGGGLGETVPSRA